jgi:iron(III) transport system substrate-binding protein
MAQDIRITRRRLLMASGAIAAAAVCGGGAPSPSSAPAGAAASPGSGDPLANLVAAAKKEGTFTLWGADDVADVQCYMGGFSQSYAGIDAQHFEITAGEGTERIITEARAGKTSLDVSIGSLDTVQPLLARDLVAKFDDWESMFKLPKGSVNGNGRLVAFYHLSHPVGVNTKALGTLPVPASWEALLDPIYKGRILVEVRGKPFGMLGTVWGEKKLTDYVTALKAQNPRILKGGTTVADSLAAGEAPLAIGTYGYKILDYAENKKAPVTYAKISPISASSFQLYVLKNATHPNAGRLFAGWMARDAGQKTLEGCTAKGSLLPGAQGKLAKEYVSNKIELIFETPENQEQGGKFEALAAKILGAK